MNYCMFCLKAIVTDGTILIHPMCDKCRERIDKFCDCTNTNGHHKNCSGWRYA